MGSFANFVSGCAHIFAGVFLGLHVAYFKHSQLILEGHDHILALLKFLAIPAAATWQKAKLAQAVGYRVVSLGGSYVFKEICDF